MHRVQARISPAALAHNLQIARSLAPGRKLLAVIKANAYGHGLLQAAEALAGADMFGVTDVYEADTLQAQGCEKAILVLQGIIQADDIRRCAERGYQLVIHSVEQLALLDDLLSAGSPVKPLHIWLKMNSGMGRLGIAADDYAATYRKLLARPYCGEVVMMTHLANASLPDSALNALQMENFSRIRASLGEPAPAASIAASSGLLSGFGLADWVRPGIMLYGSSPFAWQDEHRRRGHFGLRAVMTLEARIIAIQNLQAGDNVGYCSQFICPRDMRIGIVSIGYADGYPSNAPNGTPVMAGGQRTVTTGRVSMDMIAIDLSTIPAVQVGDTVELWGEHISLDEVAEHTGILSYNLTCSIAARVRRIYG